MVYTLIVACEGGLMSTKRKRHSAHFKFQVALEAVKGTKTVNQLASEHNLHPNQISQWKRQ